MTKVVLDVIVTHEGKLQALLQSKLSKSIIGITSASLGPGTYMTTVVELLLTEDNETIVVLKGYDMTGYFFDKSRLKIEEIENVIPFTALFENPFLRDMNREMEDEKSSKLRINY